MDNTKQRMGFEPLHGDATDESRTSDRKLAAKMTRFEAELTVGGHERRMLLRGDDERGIERIAAFDGFSEHRT